MWIDAGVHASVINFQYITAIVFGRYMVSEFRMPNQTEINEARSPRPFSHPSIDDPCYIWAVLVS